MPYWARLLASYEYFYACNNVYSMWITRIQPAQIVDKP